MTAFERSAEPWRDEWARARMALALSDHPRGRMFVLSLAWDDLSTSFRVGIEDGWHAASRDGQRGAWPTWIPEAGPDPAQMPDYDPGFQEGKRMFIAYDVRVSIEEGIGAAR